MPSKSASRASLTSTSPATGRISSPLTDAYEIILASALFASIVTMKRRRSRGVIEGGKVRYGRVVQQRGRD